MSVNIQIEQAVKMFELLGKMTGPVLITLVDDEIYDDEIYLEPCEAPEEGSSLVAIQANGELLDEGLRPKPLTDEDALAIFRSVEVFPIT